MRMTFLTILALIALSSLISSCKNGNEKGCRETCLAYVGETPGATNYRGRAGSSQEGSTMEACVKVCMDKGATAVLGYATNRATRPMCDKACRKFNVLKKNAGEQATTEGMIFGTSSGSHRACVQSCLGGATKDTIQCILSSQTPRAAQLCVVR
jgi:hypothetical protein